MAELTGKEAALFVPSGTMGNLICVLSHTWSRGAEILLGRNKTTYKVDSMLMISMLQETNLTFTSTSREVLLSWVGSIHEHWQQGRMEHFLCKSWSLK